MNVRKAAVGVVAIALAFGLAGCGKSQSADSGSPDTPASPSGDVSAAANGVVLSAAQQEALNAVMGELATHWAKGADGWTTALAAGSPGAPEHYLREVKDFTASSVDADDLSDADKLNGVTWSGSVSFQPLALREAGDPDQVAEGMGDPAASRQRGQWSVWVQYQAQSIHAEKTNGQWQFSGGGTMRDGSIPGPSDYSNAGISQ